MRRSVRRHLVAAAVVAGLVVLGVGPVQAIVAGRASWSADLAAGAPSPGPGGPAVRLPAPSLAPWPSGVWSSATATRTSLPAAARYPATAALPGVRGAHVVVGVAAVGRPLTGVGTVVTAGDLDRLDSLGTAAAARLVDRVSSVDGPALGVVSVASDDGAGCRLLSSHQGRRYRAALLAGLAASPADATVARWIQHRPDLRLIAPADPGAGSTGARACPRVPDVAPSDGVRAIVETRVLTGLTGRDGVLAPRLFSTATGTSDGPPDGGGLFDVAADGTAVPTVLGRVWLPLAHAVVPGSRVVPSVVTGVRSGPRHGPRIGVLARPSGGEAVLVWNPGAPRTLTVDVPAGADGRRTDRYTLTVPAGALTSVVLPG